MKRGRIHRGFTLVEMLVVMGLIALLMGLLLPVISSVRAESQSVHCLNNLRQIFTAVELYRQNTNELLPYAEPLPAPTADGPVGGLPAALKRSLEVDCECWTCSADSSSDLDQLRTSYSYVPGGFMLAFLPSGAGTPAFEAMSDFDRAELAARHVTRLFESGFLSKLPILADSAPRHEYGSRMPENVVFLDGSARPRKPQDDDVDLAGIELPDED